MAYCVQSFLTMYQVVELSLKLVVWEEGPVTIALLHSRPCAQLHSEPRLNSWHVTFRNRPYIIYNIIALSLVPRPHPLQVKKGLVTWTVLFVWPALGARADKNKAQI